MSKNRSARNVVGIFRVDVRSALLRARLFLLSTGKRAFYVPATPVMDLYYRSREKVVVSVTTNKGSRLHAVVVPISEERSQRTKNETGGEGHCTSLRMFGAP